ncbi:MAG: aldo/keto reductase [Marinilabiliales bacterium]|nr:MAG: aldo/keto reductase [Marinilabiliales bacterium]
MEQKSHNPGINRRKFLQFGALATVGLSVGGFKTLGSKAGVKSAAGEKTPAPPEKAVPLEWRNRQSSMAYRQLGRTGLMVSEVVAGGDPVKNDNYKHLELAMEMGLNYMDTAPAYGRGESETAFGKLLDSPAKREKVYIATKISGYSWVRNNMYREIFNGLPSAKQEAYLKEAKDTIAEKRVEQPGYFLSYWPNHINAFDGAYLSNVMMKDYGHKVEGSGEFRKAIISSLEDSLKRVGTDYFDILLCPHGASSAEELQNEEMLGTIEYLKKQGKIRFLGVSTHNDPAGVISAATNTGKYDMVMASYNIINGGFLEDAIRNAKENGVGIIAMKAAMAVATHHSRLEIPEWRVAKVNRVVPGDLKPPMKAYLWALQNPNITAVISNLWDETYIRENLSLAGKKVELQMG